MTTREVASAAGASPRTVRWWIARGWLRAAPTTRGWTIAAEDWLRCLEEHEHEMRPTCYAAATPGAKK